MGRGKAATAEAMHKDTAGAPAETPEERFRRNATRRTRAVLRSLRVLGNCADRRRYAYTDEQAAAMFQVLGEALEQARLRFSPESSELAEDVFSL
jgi:hypothetical protein